MSDSETARQTAADLEQKLAKITARSIELADERRRLAFDANTGDSAAEKRLKALNTEAAHINLDTENVRSAIEEGKRRLAAAVRDEETAQDRANARQALEIGEQLVAHARAIDAAFATAQAEMMAYEARGRHAPRYRLCQPYLHAVPFLRWPCGLHCPDEPARQGGSWTSGAERKADLHRPRKRLAQFRRPLG